MRQVSETKERVRAAGLIAAGLAVMVSSGASVAAEHDPGSEILGWIENVTLFPGGLRLTAKLDTGARTSSVDVRDYDIFSRNGQRWVRFRLSDRNGGSADLERPVVRFARVRRSQSKTVRRPVVMLGVCLGARYREVEVNLAKRSHLNYPMLVGRTSMSGITVDPSRKFTAEPVCQVPSEAAKAR